MLTTPGSVFTDTSVQLEDLVTRWRESGSGELGTVLMLHSLGLDRCAFDPLRAALPGGWRLVSYDQRGHGGARSEIQSGWQQYVDDARHALDRCGDAPVHLMGHSMGGAVAACVAALQPHRVASLGVVASPPCGMPAFAQRGQAVMNDGMPAAVEATISRWFANEAASGTGTHAMAYARAALSAMTPTAMAAAWHALACFPGYTDLAHSLPRVLCIAGADDLSTPPAVMYRIVQHVTGTCSAADIRLEMIEGAGHMVPLTAPASVAALLEEHWRSGTHAHA